MRGPLRFALTTHWQSINQVKQSVGEILSDHSNLRRLVNLTRAATVVQALALGDLTATADHAYYYSSKSSECVPARTKMMVLPSSR